MRYRSDSGFRMTPIVFLIILNFIVLIATFISPQVIVFLGLRPATFLSQPWSIITNLFVHAGLWHFFANMITLYFFGNFLSRLIGEQKFLMLYFAGGIMGNIFHIIISFLGYFLSVSFLGSPFTPLIGASGAVFALGGALAVMTPRLRVYVIPIPAPIPLWVAVIGGFIVLSLLSINLNISWQGHLGGLIAGLIAGLFFKRKMRSYF